MSVVSETILRHALDLRSRLNSERRPALLGFDWEYHRHCGVLDQKHTVCFRYYSEQLVVLLLVYHVPNVSEHLVVEERVRHWSSGGNPIRKIEQVLI